MTVTTKCADNSHIFNSTSLNSSRNVLCVSDGNWSGQIPECQCDEGYHEMNVSGTQICQGELISIFYVFMILSNSGQNLKTMQDSADPSPVISISVISFLLILSLTVVISIIIIVCGVKLRNRTPSDIEARKTSAHHMRVEKQKDGSKKQDVPVAPNKAYAVHNVSRCIKVSTNEAYAVNDRIRDDEIVYEQVK